MAQTVNQKASITNMRGQPKPEGKISYQEFLDWADEDTLAEWVDGEIEMSSPASVKHQQILGFLHHLIDLFVMRNNLGMVLLPPFQMKLPGSSPGREPDLVFVSNSRLNRLQNARLQGPADLVIEITSPESIERDRQTKFKEYAAGGVLEYWLLDAINNEAFFYRLDQSGQYQLQVPNADGRYYSTSIPGFWLKPDWLWQSPLPSIFDLLHELDVL